MARIKGDFDVVGKVVMYASDDDAYPAFVLDPVTGEVSIGDGSSAPTLTTTLSTGVTKLPDGTAAAPALVFASDTDTGWFSSSGGQWVFAVGGAQEIEMNAGAFRPASSGGNNLGSENKEWSNLWALVGNFGVVTGGRTVITTKATAVTGMSGATATASDAIPAGCYLLGITAYVDTEIEGATSFDIGDGTDADRWGAAIALAAGTEVDLSDLVGTGPAVFTSANDVVLTANGSNFTAGAVTITAHYITLDPGT